MKKILTAMLALGLASSAIAQPSFRPQTRASLTAEPNAIALYQGTAPGSESATQKEVWSDVNSEFGSATLPRQR